MSVAFSSDGEKVIGRKLDTAITGVDQSSRSELNSYYEIERCKNFVQNSCFQKVALQFPDHLLGDSTRVAFILAKETGSEVFILGDTSYGSCCVDEVAAEHNAADCVIHFGASCLTRTKRLPVLFVFGREEVDVDHCSHCFRETFPSQDSHVLVLYDTTYSHCIDELRERVADYKNCVISHLDLPESVEGTGSRASVPEPAVVPVPSTGSSPPSHLSIAPGTVASSRSSASTSDISTLTTSGTVSSSSSTHISPSPVSPTHLSANPSVVALASAASAAAASSSSTLSSAEATPSVEDAGGKSQSVSQCSCMTTSGGMSSEESGINHYFRTTACSTCCCGPSNLVYNSKDQTEDSAVTKVSRLSHQKDLHGNNKDCGEGSIHAGGIEGLELVHRRFERSFQLSSPIETYDVFFIGKEGPSLSNFLLNYSRCQFTSYDPATKRCRKESVSVNKTLGKRYYLVQKAKEARTVGIIVGTLGAADYLEVIERMKRVLKQAGKKYYTIAVGKLNVPKIANFLEIDIFVLVACPENSLIDSQEFFRPVITPYELELACLRSKEWTGEYSTDYQDLLPGARFHSVLEEEGEEEAEPEFSLITGAFVPTRESSQSEQGHSMALQTRSKMEVMERDSAMGFLQRRTWQGLEQKLGETEVGVAVEGRCGIAVAYENEQH